jgi:antirestriction protein ArdC
MLFTNRVTTMAINAATKRSYMGAQSTVLNAPSGEYAGFKQWLDLGFQVKAGEKATKILLPFNKLDEKTGITEQRFKTVCVFSREQVEPRSRA